MKTTLLFFFIINLQSCTSPSQIGKKWLLGTWHKSERYIPWMSKTEQVFRSSVTLTKKNKRHFIAIEISGHHACEMEGYVTLEKNKIIFNSSDKNNLRLESNFKKGTPCLIVLANHDHSLKIESQTAECNIACGNNQQFVGHEFFK